MVKRVVKRVVRGGKIVMIEGVKVCGVIKGVRDLGEKWGNRVG